MIRDISRNTTVMMNLILWRHADADDGIPDITRRLTEKGQKQAQMMAAWLKPRLPDNTRILVSPAARAQQTVQALTTDYTTVNLLALGASAEQILNVAGWPVANENVLIVGHQPSLGMAAARAMTGKSDYWSVRKGAIWWLASRVRGDERQTLLRAVLTPEMLES